jgi:hypothetical protein
MLVEKNANVGKNANEVTRMRSQGRVRFPRFTYEQLETLGVTVQNAAVPMFASVMPVALTSELATLLERHLPTARNVSTESARCRPQERSKWVLRLSHRPHGCTRRFYSTRSAKRILRRSTDTSRAAPTGGFCASKTKLPSWTATNISLTTPTKS